MGSSDTRRTIVQLLSHMGDSREVRAYLDRFSEADQARFAVIAVGGRVLQEQLDEIAAAFAFLHRVGLTPIVLHADGPRLDAELARRGIESRRYRGYRVTTPEVLDVARDVFFGENIRLVEAIRAQGVMAHSLPTGAIEADPLADDWGFVGRPTKVRLGLLSSAVSSGAVPILTCLGIAPGGQLLNVRGEDATRALVEALQPIKIVFVDDEGAIVDGAGVPVPSVNLASDYEALAAEPLGELSRLKLDEAKRLVEGLPSASSVSLTTPSGLVRELFTHGGAGTLVRMGEFIHTISARSEVDSVRLFELVEGAFDRTLRTDWWAGLDLDLVVVSESYRAGAVLARLDGAAYLDKFAVRATARGEGLARAVWQAVGQSRQHFYWRSRSDNPFNAFYHQEASGSVRRGPWTVFWRGDTDLATAAPMVERVAGVPDSFDPQV
ncbi:MAG: acetylglutamate kinase [Myxococcota bacterium]